MYRTPGVTTDKAYHCSKHLPIACITYNAGKHVKACRNLKYSTHCRPVCACAYVCMCVCAHSRETGLDLVRIWPAF